MTDLTTGAAMRMMSVGHDLFISLHSSFVLTYPYCQNMLFLNVTMVLYIDIDVLSAQFFEKEIPLKPYSQESEQKLWNYFFFLKKSLLIRSYTVTFCFLPF